MDATCGRIHLEPVTTRHFLAGTDGGLQNVLVYIKEGARQSPSIGKVPRLDQVGCLYEP